VGESREESRSCRLCTIFRLLLVFQGSCHLNYQNISSLRQLDGVERRAAERDMSELGKAEAVNNASAWPMICRVASDATPMAKT
jgi:hypothetical protein